MTLKPIRTEQEYDEIMVWIDEQFDQRVKPGTPQGDTLQVVLLLVKSYEDEHYPIPAPDPIEAIRLKMQEQGIRNKDFVGRLGSKSYVSAVLNRKKPMTIDMARFFHKELGIPASVLLA